MIIGNKQKAILKVLLFIAIVYCPVFLHLENLPIRLWDESRLAVNAVEMHQNGNYIVTHYDGKPDMWSTKPPLMIWLQVLSIKVLGVNELAVRLPAGIAAFLTCLTVLLFALRFLKNYWLGIISVLILVTADGYIDLHVSRSGDYDSLLIFFTTLYSVCFFIYVESKAPGWMLSFFIALMLAVMTKGIAGMLFTPALFLYALVKGKVISTLKEGNFYIGIIIFITVVGGYYLLREHYNPGYLKAISKNELGGRYLQTLECHQHPYWYYYFSLVNARFSPWYLLVPAGIITGFFMKDDLLRNLTLFLTLLSLTYFFVISSAQTRIQWYDAPLFPFLSLIAGVFVWFCFHLVANTDVVSRMLKVNVFPFALLVILFFIPYSGIVDKVYFPVESYNDDELNGFTRFLQKGIHGKMNLDNRLVCYEGYKAPGIFYLDALNKNGVKVAFADWKRLNAGDTVIAFCSNTKQSIEAWYDYEVADNYNGVKIYSIKKPYGCEN